MLTLETTSDALEALYVEYKEEAKGLLADIASLGKRMTLKPDVDLLKVGSVGSVVYIIEGYFRMIFSKKVVRLYSEDDFVGAHHHVDDALIASEFASEIVLFKWSDLFRAFSENPALNQKWCRLMDMENKINLGLCAQLVDERVQPSLELRQFKEGEVIIEEGTEATEIYEMISGVASVSVGGSDVGEIGTGEIFGEMSFLAECPRTATVTADSGCCIRVVKKDDFFALLEVDHHLSAAIAKTMAKRVIELNHRLAGIG